MSNDNFQKRYGPTALVTGASSGIGRAFSEQLAAQGLDLILVARRVDRLQALASSLQDQHAIAVTVVQADLATPQAIATIREATASQDIGLAILNAGFGYKGAFDGAAPELLADMLAVNAAAPLLLAREFVPRLRARGKGGLVLTSSVEGFMGGPFSAAYAATKSFVTSLSEGLWAELTPEGIDVLALCPGATDTEAPRLQGIDPATLRNVMSPDAVAQLALANLSEGPTFVPSEHYKASFDQLLSLPRRTALQAMANAMKPA